MPRVALAALTLLPRSWSLSQVIEVKHEYRSPDCVDRLSVTANGQIPGPTIVAEPGEEVEITVRNHMTGQAVSMHWHGMVHKESGPWQDGSAMITSCPIPPMSSFVYKFKVNNRPGTYQYHGHVGGVRNAGLGGAFIIKGNISEHAAEASGGEKVFHLKDWWHAEETQLVQGLLEPRFRWPGDPQSVLINGKGFFNCTENAVYACSGSTCVEGYTSAALHTATAGGGSNDTDDQPDVLKEVCGANQRPYYRPSYHPPPCSMEQCPGYETMEVTSGNTYLLRFINGGSLSLFNVALQNHSMTVVEVDGHPTQKHATGSVDVNSGQRVSVLVTMDQDPDIYVLKVTTRARSALRVGYAMVKYAGASRSVDDIDPAAVQVLQPEWSDNEFTFAFQNAIKGLYDGAEGLDAVPDDGSVQRTFVMLNTQERMDYSATTNGDPSVDDLSQAVGEFPSRPQDKCDSAGNTKPLRWLLGRRWFKKPPTPVLSGLYFGIDTQQQTEDNGYYAVGLDQVYDLVIQNYPACNGVCETHAWHVHGMHFWVLGTGRGAWTGSQEQRAKLNKADPPMRDVTQTISEGTDNMPWGTNSTAYAPCGWTMIRFRVESPGAWFFHCHQLWHIVMGSNAVFYTPASSIPAPPPNLLLCGDMTVQRVAKKLEEADVLDIRGNSQFQAVVGSAPGSATLGAGPLVAGLVLVLTALSADATVF